MVFLCAVCFIGRNRDVVFGVKLFNILWVHLNPGKQNYKNPRWTYRPQILWRTLEQQYRLGRTKPQRDRRWNLHLLLAHQTPKWKFSLQEERFQKSPTISPFWHLWGVIEYFFPTLVALMRLMLEFRHCFTTETLFLELISHDDPVRQHLTHLFRELGAENRLHPGMRCDVFVLLCGSKWPRPHCEVLVCEEH